MDISISTCCTRCNTIIAKRVGLYTFVAGIYQFRSFLGIQKDRTNNRFSQANKNTCKIHAFCRCCNLIMNSIL